MATHHKSSLIRRIYRRFGEAAYELSFALFATLYGVVNLTHHGATPGSVEDNLPGWLVWMWVLSLLLGGICSIAGRLSGYIRVEIVGQVAVAYGVALYAGASIVGSVGVYTSLAYLAFAASAVIRARVLSKALKAEEMAETIQRRKER